MTTIAYRILEFESIIKKLIITNHKFFAVATFSKISSFTCINSIAIQHLIFNKIHIISNLQKDFRQNNLSFACLQFYEHKNVNILPGNICFGKK